MTEESPHSSDAAADRENNNNPAYAQLQHPPSGSPALTSTGRTIQACDRCRFKKVRCDGTVPACGRCKAAGLECLTTVKLNRKSYPRSYTESIEERLRQLEAEVHKLRVGNDSKDKRIKELEASGANIASPRQAGTSTTSNRPDTVAKLGPRPATDEPLSREVGRMNLDRRGIGRFMGSSSGIFFIGTAEQRFCLSQNPPDKKVGDALLRVDVDDESTEYPVHYAVNTSATLTPLPPRETAQGYIDAWFDAWRHIFPILHRPSFTNSINQLYSAPASEHDWCVLGLFYLILALGCRHLFMIGEVVDGQPTVESNQEDIEYYSQSSKYHNDILAMNNLATMQYQELQTLWFLYTGKRSLAFQMTGSMTRLALELGLHRHTRRFQFDPLETELRKRVFWVCYMLDNFVCAIYGLPKSFRDQDIDVELPSDVDDDFVNQSGYLLSLPGEPTGMLTFVSLIKVVRVLSNTLEILYTTTDRRQTVTKIKTIDRLLDQWIHTLPDHLQLDPSAFTHPSASSKETLLLIEPSIAFLHISYLYTRLAAHRVALSFFRSEPQYAISLTKCMEFAKELISLNSRALRHLLVFDVNPGSHVYTLWSCGLLSLFGLPEFLSGEPKIERSPKKESDIKTSVSACVDLLEALVAAGRTGEKVRADNLRCISAGLSESGTIPSPNTLQTDHRESWYQQPPQLMVQPHQQQPQRQQSGDTSHVPPPSTHTPEILSPPPPPPFPQFLQQTLFGHPSPTPPLPTSDSQIQNPTQLQPPQPPHLQGIDLHSQSPGLSRLAMSANSPAFISNFNIDFSSPLAHPYDRLADAFHSPTSAAVPDNSNSASNTSTSQQIAAGLNQPTHQQNHHHHHHGSHQQSQSHPHPHPHPHPHQHQHHAMRQVWGDPVFNVSSIMQVSEPGGGVGDNSNNDGASFVMQDVLSSESIGIGVGVGVGMGMGIGQGDGERNGDGDGRGGRGGARKRARVGSSN
ncbi:uncharacterized protein PADG_03249 [Paracoccidioides brasiliensis Pb18]|uniref:Zn(2)-C6 fungal-type domain-containing protein n=1 Tax=Paracoccidioides brasiliensis (strain Pb18) TaxID=502780 RepID=C1G7U4_PARBD|nr:uncharacterized protein PADG_03249 [Paracoccidioides brasiliensis Pb18]EEH47151.2 hypothetical protein PADG_03249 [Paracoccidioides brasiliensis Pb18]